VRILVAEPGPGYSVQDVHAGWVEALRNAGQKVFEFNLSDRLLFYSNALLETDQPGRFKRAFGTDEAIDLAVNGLYAAILKICPDVLIVVSAFFVPPALLNRAREVGVKVDLIHTESPYEDERQLALAPHASLNILNDPTNLERFRTVAPTEYFCHAYRPTVHHPGNPVPVLACDLGFVGTGFPSRVEFFEAMDLDGLDVVLAGNWKLLGGDSDGSPLAQYVVHGLEDCLDNQQTADLYRSAKVGINLYRREARENDTAEGWACGPREIEMAACGLPFVRDPRPESDELFGSILPTFSTPDEAAEQVRWLLAHEGIRQTAAEKARAAIQDRTFQAHAARLLRLLERE
jgi:spore maturation protein CgeB